MVMEGERISYHESVRRVYDRIKKDGMNNIWDRYEAQGMGGNPDQRCPFCMGGVRCDLCSNGPCRADVSINGESHEVHEGEVLIIPANEPHAQKAIERFKMLLIMIRL
jgi:hydroxylamine reductase (hybrid-cluster protein)